jgi:hypothetical protein
MPDLLQAAAFILLLKKRLLNFKVVSGILIPCVQYALSKNF